MLLKNKPELARPLQLSDLARNALAQRWVLNLTYEIVYCSHRISTARIAQRCVSTGWSVNFI